MGNADEETGAGSGTSRRTRETCVLVKGKELDERGQSCRCQAATVTTNKRAFFPPTP